METAIDANVVFRILISQGEILSVVFNPSLLLIAPERLKEEFIKHKTEDTGSLMRVELSTQDDSNIFNKLYKSFESPVRSAQSDSSEDSYLVVWSGNSNSLVYDFS